ncbi:branched-chain amino acid ABC transporter permease [Enterovirga rhinocerotis]|uniref:Amino acid/amide ABC transporter membrane protein 2 (HAAT family) n=1 Tax=Enterovirga rhinocerotis TaxID=1339210 RepID=A0A4R7BWY8_9HYPH|nr:branched-chain amino acid ABC transporter permease [Enterovirga rhinocerotis]TDR89712.1 amino acid/amide ABC transporter membrane protein 2 (HAAT family) [Enterovirga rhinocerotis]
MASSTPQAWRFPDLTTAIVVVILAVMPFLVPTTLASQVAIFATATLSVTLLLGSVGLLSFGQGLYLGFGAYLTGLLLRDAGLGLLPTLVLATTAGTVLAGLLGILMVRRQGVYFVMLTLAFAQMGYFAMLSLKDITGGENGLTDLPRTMSLAGLPIGSPLSFYLLTAGAFLLAFLAVQRLNASPFGSVLTAIRENEGRSEAMGYDVKRYKIAAVAIAGGIAGLAGGLHAAFLGFVPPNDIELEISQRILVMAIIGGVGSPAGALVGSVFYTLVSEALSELWARWMALIALLLIAIVLYLPGGLWSIGRRLAERFGGRSADA